MQQPATDTATNASTVGPHAEPDGLERARVPLIINALLASIIERKDPVLVSAAEFFESDFWRRVIPPELSKLDSEMEQATQTHVKVDQHALRLHRLPALDKSASPLYTAVCRDKASPQTRHRPY